MRAKLSCLLAFWFAACSGLIDAAERSVIASGQGRLGPKQPQLAVGPDGTIHLVYGSGDRVFYTASRDGGETFSEPRAAFACPNLVLGMRRGPRIAAAGKSVVVSVIGGPEGRGRDGDLQAWRSADDGRTWSGPIRVNDAPASAREGLHGMAAGGDGSVWCTWLDLRSRKTEIYASRSTDGGASWGPNRLVYRSQGGSVCECCHPSIALGPAGRIAIMFRNSLGGERDMYLASSEDGHTFAPARKLGEGAWRLDACPMDGGAVTFDAGGTLHAVWNRDGRIYAGRADGAERLLGPGEQPWVGSSERAVSVWTVGRQGDLMVMRPDGKPAERLAGNARDPVVAAVGPSKAVVCWEDETRGLRRVLAGPVTLK